MQRSIYILASKHLVILMDDMNDFSFSIPMDIIESTGSINSWREGAMVMAVRFTKIGYV